jgi:hypothetical protein
MMEETVHLVRITPAGGVDTLLSLCGRHWIGIVGADGRSESTILRPFSPSAVIAASDDSFTTGVTARYELTERTPEGRVRRILRVSDADQAISAEDVDRLTARMLEQAPVEPLKSQIRSAFTDFPLPEAKPAFERVEYGADGRLWVERFRTESTAGATWDVFDREGVWSGAVHLPAGLDLVGLAEDHFVGVEQTPAGPPVVTVYRLRRD